MVANVLDTIVADKQQEIAHRKIDFPLSAFIDDLVPTTKDFYAQLAKPTPSYILECKKASPSKGLIRADFNLDEIIAAYAQYAACISVLTDEKYFQGTFEYLQYVTSRVSQPVINKDFFIDEYQVHLARYYQADAVLLMLSVLDDKQYQQLHALASFYNMAVLTEVSNEEEVMRALALKAKIIGINNRDLRDLSTDLATTEALVPMIKNGGHTGVIISESGIYTHQDVVRLSPLVNGFLVGSALMAQDDLTFALQQLLFGKVKICGITNIADAAYVKQSPASYAGLIFAEKSPRAVTLEQALIIRKEIPQNYVGVFVNAPLTTLVNYAKALDLAAIQLHGNEEQAYITELRSLLPAKVQIWKAIAIEISQDQKAPSLSLEHVDVFLLDCKVGDSSGGTGRSFNWLLLDQYTEEDKLRMGLAGGLTVSNIVSAAKTNVALLDVNSGVENAPGEKSNEAIAALFTALRAY